MFGFRNQPPPTCPSNAASLGCAGTVAFANGERSWTEQFDLVVQAADALKSHGHSVINRKTWLEHADSGFTILPLLAEFQPLDGGVRTVTTVQINHPTLVPNGLFEYQHSSGHSMVDSLTKGFDQWVQVDFVTLLEALLDKPERCGAMEMEFPAKNGRPARVRRAIFGPTSYLAQHPPEGPEEHPFCPCCLLMSSFEKFRSLVEDDAFYGLRLFAARGEDDKPMADCRVNGDDWEEGAKALREYASSWRPAGIEFRKQYVVLRTVTRSPKA